MVCAESLCCGTPVVGFKAGAPEQIALPEYSSFVEYGDVDSMAEKIERLLECPETGECIEKEAGKAYSKQTMTENYRKVYGMIYESTGKEKQI